VIWFCGAATTWRTMMSSRVLTSTTESECHGLIQVYYEIEWQKHLQTNLGIFKVECVPVGEDNSAAIQLSGEATYHKRSKHFSLEWFRVKEAVDEKEIQLDFTPTDDQLADFLTKNLYGAKFVKFRGCIMGDEILQGYFTTRPTPLE
jgi:hypothetical protein